MKVVNLPQTGNHPEHISDAEKYTGDSRETFNQILSETINGGNCEAHKAESMIFRRLLEPGLILLKLFFANHNQGDYGKRIETAQGSAVRGRRGSRKYFSVFGKMTVSRYLYHTGEKTFAPLDIMLNLPDRCYSYFLSEMISLLNIKGSCSEGVGFVKKFFGLQISVSASETISGESSPCCEKYYENREIPDDCGESDDKKDCTVASFDGKGIPMIKKEAAKIKGRQGKGRKRQKKKESPAGAEYEIDANIRSADEVAKNLAYPEKKEENPDIRKYVKAQNVRYIASISKPKKEVMGEIYEEVRNKDFSRTPLLCLMDGSPCLWDYLKTVFSEIPNKICIPDIIHVLEYIWIAAHIMYKEGSDNAKKYVFEKLKLILDGNIASCITELQTEMQKDRRKKKSCQEKFEKVITYFRNHRQYMNCDGYLSKGYPTGTGIIESACGHPVKDRMEISGTGRGVDGAESILRLRSAVKSGDRDEYWNFFTVQAKKNHFFPDEHNQLNLNEKAYA